MLNTILYYLTLFLPVGYLGVSLLYLFRFLEVREQSPNDRTIPLSRTGLLILILFHSGYSLLLTLKNDIPPIANTFQLMSLIALTLAVIYSLIETATKIYQTGVFVISVSLIFQVMSSSLLDNSEPPNAALKSPLMQGHIIAALLGYSAVTIAGIYSVLYIILFRQIQSNSYGLLFDKLPNLEMMERLSLTAVRFAFFFLSIAFIAGTIILTQNTEKVTLFADPKLVGTIIVWLFYGVALLFRKQLGIRGKKMAFILIFGFVFAFLSMTVLNLFSSKFHGV